MKNKIFIVAATQFPVNRVVKNWIILAVRLFKSYEIQLISNSDYDEICIPNIKELKIEMDDSLFDFSRYHAAISSNLIRDSDTVILFNDTLGNGRKFGVFLFLFMLIGIWAVSQNFACMAGPYDRDKKGSWLSPYFMISKNIFLKNLNFVNVDKAVGTLDPSLYEHVNFWLDHKWRGAGRCSDRQRKIKLNTLILERCLLSDQQKKNMLKFSRMNILRILNSFS